MRSAGSWTVLRGRQSPTALETKLGHIVCKLQLVFLTLCLFSPLENRCNAQKGSRFTLCLSTRGRQKPVALVLSDIVKVMPTLSSGFEMVGVTQMEEIGLSCHVQDLSFLPNWDTRGHWRICVGCILKSLFRRDIKFEHGNLEC